MDVELSNEQAEFFVSEAKSVAAVAGFGSGKTQVAMLRMFSTMFQYDRANMLYCAPTFPLIRDIFYPKVEEFLEGLGQRYHINKGEHTIKLHGYGRVFCRTMEHPERIVGFEVLDTFLDELDILPELKALEVWRKCKARCRQKLGKKSQMFLTTTPEGFKATFKLFKKNPLPNSHLVKMSTYSNAHNLPDDYIDELKANYPAQLIEAYINGEFVNLVGMPVWGAYDSIKNGSTVTVRKDDPLIIGMDFNVGRGCAVIWVERDGFLHAADEVYNSYDTPDTIRVLKERYPKHDITIYPDASGNSRKSVNATISDLALLRQAGYTVKVNKSNPNIKDRIMATNAMFCNGFFERRLFVNENKCPQFSEGLQQQIYDKNGLPEKGANEADDITDAGTYPIAYLYPIKQRITSSTGLEALL
jgi:PBSX family phage terminase large subunit